MNLSEFLNKHTRLILLLLMVLAAVIRIPYIQDHPTGFHKGRQHYDFLISRGIFYKYFSPPLSEKDTWKKSVAIFQGERQEVLEPIALQWMGAIIFALRGREDIESIRWMMVLLWYLAGIVLFKLARKTQGSPQGFLVFGFFLFAPYSILISTGFMPDGLMLAALLGALFAMWDYFHAPGRREWVRMLFISAIAAGIKPLCLFPLAGCFFLLSWNELGLIGTLKKLRSWIYAGVLMSPIILYYAYRIVSGDFLLWQFQVSIVPGYIVSRDFWLGWKALLGIAIGFTPALAAFAGIFFMTKMKSRILMLGYGLGYFLFGLTFTYQIHTHDYYHLMLLPWVCLGVASLLFRILSCCSGTRKRIFIWIVMLVLSGFAFWHGAQKVKYIEESYQFPGHYQVVEKAKLVGDITSHSQNIIYLCGSWGEGKMLQYYGWVFGEYWPSWEQMGFEKIRGIERVSAKTRFDLLQARARSDYFVVFDKDQWALQGDLQNFLKDNFPVVFDAQGVIIFDLKKPLHA